MDVRVVNLKIKARMAQVTKLQTALDTEKAEKANLEAQRQQLQDRYKKRKEITDEYKAALQDLDEQYNTGEIKKKEYNANKKALGEQYDNDILSREDYQEKLAAINDDLQKSHNKIVKLQNDLGPISKECNDLIASLMNDPDYKKQVEDELKTSYEEKKKEAGEKKEKLLAIYQFISDNTTMQNAVRTIFQAQSTIKSLESSKSRLDSSTDAKKIANIDRQIDMQESIINTNKTAIDTVITNEGIVNISADDILDMAKEIDYDSKKDIFQNLETNLDQTDDEIKKYQSYIDVISPPTPREDNTNTGPDNTNTRPDNTNTGPDNTNTRTDDKRARNEPKGLNWFQRAVNGIKGTANRVAEAVNKIVRRDVFKGPQKAIAAAQLQENIQQTNTFRESLKVDPGGNAEAIVRAAMEKDIQDRATNASAEQEATK